MVPIQYKDLQFDEGFRADLIVGEKVILELKSVEKVSPAHRKQIQTYLRLTGRKSGYLLNFGEALMKDGIIRAANGLEESHSLRRRMLLTFSLLCVSASPRELLPRSLDFFTYTRTEHATGLDPAN